MSKQCNFIPAGMESDDSEDSDYMLNDAMRKNIKKTAANLRVKIIPDITANAALDGSSFDTTLTQDKLEWMEKIRSTWVAYKKGVILTNLLREFYTQSDNPFLDGLKFYARLHLGTTVKANSIEYMVIEELHAFKTTATAIDFAPYLDSNLKMIAFNLANRSNQPGFFKLVITTYELIQSNDMFMPKINALIAEHNYKDACHIAKELKLHDSFTIYDFVFPLILQDRTTVAEPFLQEATQMHHPLIILLDSLLDRSSSILNKCDPYVAYYGYKDLCIWKWQPKALAKLIKRLARSFNLPEDLTPNVAKGKQFGQLQFLMRKHYYERGTSRDAFREMVREILPAHAETYLKLELIDTCTNNNDFEEALYWADFFQIPKGQMPSLLQNHIKEQRCDPVRKNKNRQSDQSADHSKKHSPKHTEPNDSRYYSLHLDRANVHLVDSRERFDSMLAYLVRQTMVAFDAEWKPIGSMATSKVALIQFATAECVYLLDAVTIDINEEAWNRLAVELFNNSEVLKIAFSPMSDMRMFQRLMPTFSLSAQALHSYLDLQSFRNRLIRVPAFKFPYQDDETVESGSALSSLVHVCFGKPLDKSNQFSNWNNRPLREEQLVYAALDAFCLIEIYALIKQCAEAVDIDFQDLMQRFLADNTNKLVMRKPGNASGHIPSNQKKSTTQNRPHSTQPRP